MEASAKVEHINNEIAYARRQIRKLTGAQQDQSQMTAISSLHRRNAPWLLGAVIMVGLAVLCVFLRELTAMVLSLLAAGVLSAIWRSRVRECLEHFQTIDRHERLLEIVRDPIAVARYIPPAPSAPAQKKKAPPDGDGWDAF